MEIAQKLENKKQELTSKMIPPDTIEYRDNQPTKDDFFDLYEAIGWNVGYGFTAEELHEAMSHSWYLVAAYHEGRLVGFGRLLSDGIYHAFVCEMIVRPSYQGQGIGKEILERLIAKCRAHNIRLVQLFSATGKADFYRKFGFEEKTGETPGMQLKKP
jgi:GNAT superfamily N-acetyltransferase